MGFNESARNDRVNDERIGDAAAAADVDVEVELRRGERVGRSGVVSEVKVREASEGRERAGRDASLGRLLSARRKRVVAMLSSDAGRARGDWVLVRLNRGRSRSCQTT